MKVLGNNILIEAPEKVEKKSVSGIIVSSGGPDTIKAEVLSVGDTVTSVSVGDTILIRSRAGMSFSHEEKNYKVLDITDILAVL